MALAAVEWRRWPRRVDCVLSRGESIGDAGGVIWILGSNRLPADRCVLIVKRLGTCPSFKSIGGGMSSGEVDATIGAANASGEDMDDGVDERVGILLMACQLKGVGATAGGSSGEGVVRDDAAVIIFKRV